MSIDNTAHLILGLPDKGKFVHRKMIWQADWIDTDIATYAELKAMANLWLMREEIVKSLTNDPDYRQEVYALRRKIEALEKE